MVVVSIKKSPPSLVRSSTPTPSGKLELSWVDRFPGLQYERPCSLHVFKHGHDPAKVIREALAKVLVPYYPLAGAFTTSEKGELMVDCTGEGALFVEAKANCTLEDLKYLDLPLVIDKEELLPQLPAGVNPSQVFITIQVTEFNCSGFIMGLRSNHALMDGIGTGQFLQALGEFARGLSEPLVPPVWCRDACPIPSHFPHNLPHFPPSLDLESLHLDIPQTEMDDLKRSFTKETGQRCSWFDVVVAKVWQCRLRAIGLAPDAEVHLLFPMDLRRLMKDKLPPTGGYYGNCIHLVKATTTNSRVTKGSIVDIVKLIRETKDAMPADLYKWVNRDPTKEEDPVAKCLAVLTYESLYVVDVSRLGFSEADYGWGTPMHSLYLPENGSFVLCTLMKPPLPKEGIRMMARCLKKEHMKKFMTEMQKAIDVIV